MQDQEDQLSQLSTIGMGMDVLLSLIRAAKSKQTLIFASTEDGVLAE